MRRLLMIALVLALAASAGAEIAIHTTNRLPTKLPADVPPNIPNLDRQGGDTIGDATVIPDIPYYITGTTTGFNDDYDEACPYTGSTSPDVVYVYTPPMERVLTIDLYGSSYDTKVYVYDEYLNLVACNDDYYPNYVSMLENVALMGGVAYFIVIDGYGGDHGEYILHILEYVPPEPCPLECPDDGFPEGEPPLVDGYVDAYNGGCNSPEFGVPFQDLFGDDQGNLAFCGVAGWYLNNGSNYRDTDWFYLYAGPTGTVEVTVDVECATVIVEGGPHDCNTPAVVQLIEIGDCESGVMTMTGYEPGGLIWFIVLSATFEPPDPDFGNEYGYNVWFSGLMPTTVATESASWSSVKALFR